MLHPSTQKLIQKLCELTEGGDIVWKEGPRQTSIFETEGYRVEVDGEQPAVRLLGADGRELETASAADLATPWPGGDGTYATRVADMARRAHRIARGAEAAISKILSSLSAPPRKAPEPEPVPAAIEFDPPVERKAAPVRTSESAAAIAAVTADMELLRRQPEPPPSPHIIPEPPPAPASQASTALGTILAASEPVIEFAPMDPEPEVQAAEEEMPLDDAPAPVAAPFPEPRAEEIPAIADMPPALEPRPFPLMAPVVPAHKPSEPQRTVAPMAGPRPSFGSTSSFARATTARSAPAFVPEPGASPAPASEAAPPKVTSGGLVITGFSAVTRQTVRMESPTSRLSQDAQPPASPPPPPPAPAAPKPGREPELASAPAKGPDIYKPWS